MATASSPSAIAFRSQSVPIGYLRLARPANLVTAAADIVAGGVISKAPANSVGWLVGASVCLYAGGVVLNDFFDRRLDAVERPERPIPAAVVSATTAAVFGAVLLLMGVALGLRASHISGIIAASIAFTALLYNAWAKKSASGPVIMGLCRALNLLLGLSAVYAVLVHLWPLAFIPLVYVLAITSLSRGEVHGGTRFVSGTVASLALCVVLTLLALPFALGSDHGVALLPFVALFTWRIGPSLLKAWRSPTAPAIRAGVHAGVVSLVVLDACLASIFGGLVEGAAVLSLSVVSAEFARFFAVT